MTARALVTLSGGQDSTTCLWWALDQFGVSNVETITFDYGQRHRIELTSAQEIAADAGVPNTILPINTFAALGGNALTDQSIAVGTNGDGELPATYVPGRNLVFLTIAAAYAWPRGIEDIITGVAQTDYSGYPDCRSDTIEALTSTLNLSLIHI